jgi:hypothetical protein
VPRLRSSRYFGGNPRYGWVLWPVPFYSEHTVVPINDDPCTDWHMQNTILVQCSKLEQNSRHKQYSLSIATRVPWSNHESQRTIGVTADGLWLSTHWYSHREEYDCCMTESIDWQLLLNAANTVRYFDESQTFGSLISSQQEVAQVDGVLTFGPSFL